MSWKVNIAEVGKPGSTIDRLAVAHREAQRLARLQRHAMRDDAGLSEPRDDAMRHVSSALRGAAGQDQHIALASAWRMLHHLESPLRHQETRRGNACRHHSQITAAVTMAPLVS